MRRRTAPCGSANGLENNGGFMDMQQRKQMIQKAFDTVAEGYDHPSLAFFPQTAQRMWSHLSPEPSACCLDVATGTGVMALEAARHLPAGSVVGVDLSEGMLRQARAKAQAQQLRNASFRQMDVDDLVFAKDHFDIVTCNFGLFFMEDMEGALRRLAHTVKPGGQIAISSFTETAFSPFAPVFLSLYEDFGRQVPPLSWKRLANVGVIEEIYRAAGITDLVFHHEPLGYALQSEQQWWDVVWNAGFRGLLNQLSESECEAFKAQHLDTVRTLCRKGENWLDTGVIIAIGKKGSASRS
jgi:ubiquinone/menaquinone biosynthesis C-methylase UbiE